MTPTQTLPRFVTSIVGPGDPVHRGPHDLARIRRIRALDIRHDSHGRCYYTLGTQVRRLRSAADYQALNARIDHPSWSEDCYTRP
jgi:hypothetical protein